MIDLQEFLNAGFSEAQASTLVRAFEITERNSAQRFALLQSVMNEGVVRLEHRMDGFDQRMDGLYHRMDNLEQRIGELTNAVGDLARVVAQGFATMEQTFGRIDERLTRIEAHLAEPGRN